jgi:hypothetical protein
MATLWELIQENSTLGPGHTFWEYVQTQDGGGTGTELIYLTGLEIQCSFQLEVQLNQPYVVSIVPDPPVILGVNSEEYTILIDDYSITM